MNRFKNSLRQYIENFTLLFYCVNFNRECIYIDHWTDELRASMLQVAQMSMKGGDKFKALKQGIDTSQKDIDKIFNRYVVKKFNDEKIKLNINLLKDIKKYFSDNINDLMYVLSQDKETYINYINNFFNFE